MMGMKTDWIQSVCSFMWHNEIMNWWGASQANGGSDLYNCIAVSTTTDTLPLDMQFIWGWLTQSRSLR